MWMEKSCMLLVWFLLLVEIYAEAETSKTVSLRCPTRLEANPGQNLTVHCELNSTGHQKTCHVKDVEVHPQEHNLHDQEPKSNTSDESRIQLFPVNIYNVIIGIYSISTTNSCGTKVNIAQLQIIVKPPPPPTAKQIRNPQRSEAILEISPQTSVSSIVVPVVFVALVPAGILAFLISKHRREKRARYQETPGEIVD